jgi:hypothetical protein
MAEVPVKDNTVGPKLSGHLDDFQYLAPIVMGDDAAEADGQPCSSCHSNAREDLCEGTRYTGKRFVAHWGWAV